MTAFNYEYWRNLFGASEKEFIEIKKEFIEIDIKPGEFLYDFTYLPKGIVLINEGTLRLVGKNEKNDLISIYKFKRNEIACAETILIGKKGTALIAADNVKGLFLKTDIFINLLFKNDKFRNLFTKISKEEYFYLAESSKITSSFESNKLLNWAKLQSNKKDKAITINPGIFKVPNFKKNWIISSCNVNNHNFGDVIEADKIITVKGDLPARIIPIPENWPPSNDKDLMIKPNKELIEQKNDEKEQIPQNNQFEKIKSLEDIYGRIDSDKSFPFEKGKGLVNEPLACFRMLSLYFDIPFRRDLIKKILQDQLNRSKNKAINIYNLAAISDLLGLKTSLIKPNSIDYLRRIPCPSIFFLNTSPVVCWKIKNDYFYLSDPKSKKIKISFNELISKLSLNELFFLIVEKTNLTPKSRFGLSWFLPSIKKYKNSLLQVLVASFFVQLLALFNPLLIQQIIDAVINQGSLKSLNVLGLLLIAMSIAQALLSSLRTFLFSDTTNKIDASLGSSIVHHLFRLPIQYFSKRSIGDVSSRVSELEKIRNFLTGTALTILLDSIFSLLYIAVMLMYSAKLTFWALSVIPLFVFLTIVISPIIKDQLREQAEANARVNSHLVETISGIETVKAQGMEIVSEWKWEKLYGRQIKAGFRNTITSTSAASISNFLQQLSGLIIIWVGASMVLKGQLSLGQLIAFRIISGYVTNPILRMSSIWQNFQEIGVSLNRLSDVVDNPNEIEITGNELPPLPPIKGKVSYEGINFSFKNDNQLQLQNINFEIPNGSFVGIVGESGSGKSTILKLLMNFYTQNQGKIKIDNFDISKVDLYSLRNQIGIVQQESLLFDGTIFSNISIANPNSTIEEVIEASKLALAHDFIENLPSGYFNKINEKGTELSGGQRQRIAIARMILNNPKLVILDEATSALDVKTEKKVVQNLLEKFSEKTIFFISHRLHNLVNADKILVMKKGLLVEEGNHNKLIKNNGHYANLFKSQEITF